MGTLVETKPNDRSRRRWAARLGAVAIAAASLCGLAPATPVAAATVNDFGVAFQANTTMLWNVAGAGNIDYQLGMMPGTNPSIAALQGGGYQSAFQANTGELYTTGKQGAINWKLGMMPGTSPAITGLPGGGFQVAFQANTGELWTVGAAGNANWRLGMAPGTSPAIAALPNGGFQVAFQANTGELWTVGNAGNANWQLGMAPKTSPAITALSNGSFQVAFQANTSHLWTVGGAGNANWQLGMAPETSPSIAGLWTGGFQVAFQANTNHLWTVGNAGNADWQLGMMAKTSPAIAALADGGFEVAYQANTSHLWTVGNSGNINWQLGMAGATAPAIAGRLPVFPNAGAGVTMDDLRAINRYTPANMADALPELNRRMASVGITTPKRKAAFLANLAQESGFRYDVIEVIPAGSTCPNITGGCTYRGRGFIQLTHTFNYKTYGDILGVDLLGNPELARSAQYSPAIATTFWDRQGLNPYADAGDMLTITKKINGGTNGLAGRCAFYRAAMIRFTGSYTGANGC